MDSALKLFRATYSLCLVLVMAILTAYWILGLALGQTIGPLTVQQRGALLVLCVLYASHVGYQIAEEVRKKK